MAEGTRAEARLAAAHRDLARLLPLRDRIAAAGVDVEELFGLPQLYAYALLGEHDGARIEREVGPLLPHYIEKGLVPNASISLAEARLLLALSNRLEGILSLEERIAIKIERPHDDAVQPNLIHCIAGLRGLWGQRMRIPIVFAAGTDHIYVRPDPIFGVKHLSRKLLPSDEQPIWIELPCDDGEIVVAAVSHRAEIATHRIRIEVSA